MSRSFLLAAVGLLIAVGLAAFLLFEPVEKARSTVLAEEGPKRGSTEGTPAAIDVRAEDVGRSTDETESVPAVAAVAGQSEADALQSPLVFRGSVLDPARRPLAGAEVVARRFNGASASLSVTAATNSEGRFVIGVPERYGWGWRVEARSAGFAPAFLSGVPSGLPEVDLGPIVLYPSVSLSGRVIDREKRPIAGARVFVKTAEIQDEESGDESDAPRYEARAITSADGAFAIASLPPGKVTIGVQAEGFADGVRPGALLRTDGPNQVEMTLKPDEPIVGTVVEKAGATIAGARVHAQQDDSQSAFWRKPVESDAQGRFTLAGLQANRRGLAVRIEKFGYSQLWVQATHLPADGKFVLREARALTVRTEGEGGSPAPAIRSVRFERKSRSNRWSGWNEVARSQREEVSPSEWKVATESTGALRAVVTTEAGLVGRSVEFQATAEGVSVTDLTVTFERPGAIAGRVVGRDFSPVAGVKVLYSHFVSGPQRVERVATSGEDGSFVFSGLPSGKGQISVHSAEWVASDVPCEVLAGETLPGQDVIVSHPSTLRGRLTIDGAAPGEEIPIAFHLVEYRNGNPRWRLVNLATARADGTFVAAPIPSGQIALVPKRRVDPEHGSMRSFNNESVHPEWNPEQAKAWAWIVDVPPESEIRYDLDIPEPRRGLIAGRVHVNGEPRSGVTLWLEKVEGNDWRSDTTDGEGRFQFKTELAGEYQVQLWGDGFNESRKVSLGEGETTEIFFDLVSGGVEGAVSDRSGQALSVRVQLERKRERNASGEMSWFDSPDMMTRADGSYSFTDVSAGTYRAVVNDPRRHWATMASEPFTIGARERLQVPLLTLPRAAPLVVEVKDPDGKPLSGRVLVSAADGAKPLVRKTTTGWLRNGRARVDALPPGPIVVRFRLNGPWSADDQTVTLPEDGRETPISVAAKKKEGAPEGTEASSHESLMIRSLGYAGGQVFVSDGSVMVHGASSFEDFDFGEWEGGVIYSQSDGDW